MPFVDPGAQTVQDGTWVAQSSQVAETVAGKMVGKAAVEAADRLG